MGAPSKLSSTRKAVLRPRWRAQLPARLLGVVLKIPLRTSVPPLLDKLAASLQTTWKSPTRRFVTPWEFVVELLSESIGPVFFVMICDVVGQPGCHILFGYSNLAVMICSARYLCLAGAMTQFLCCQRPA